MKHFSTNSSLGATMVPQARMRYHASTDASLFSSSLPVFPRENLNLKDIDPCHGVGDDLSYGIDLISEDLQGCSLVENAEEDEIGSLLPDDEKDLLAGVMDDFDFSLISGSCIVEDTEEDDDLFGSGGGMELEGSQMEDSSVGISKISFSDGVIGNGVSLYNVQNSLGSVMGEHPYGEHPSRTLFVRNINSNVEDSELKTLFEQYGDIRTLYTACKHRGFVMISYYDIRAARTAMRALQNKPLRRRKLDIHFSIPKDNPTDKDINQGTLVVFNLDSSVSNEELLQIFGAYGEVKEIRETPHKRHHKFVEFYDVRAAEAALKSLNRCDIAGKRIKLEPSRPGGARRNFMLQLNQDVEQDDSRTFQHSIGSPATNSPPGSWVQMNKPIEHGPVPSVSQTAIFSGLASTVPLSSSSAKVAPIGKDQRMSSLMDNSFPRTMFQQSSSSSESKIHGECEANSDRSVMETLSAPEFLWGSHSSRIPVSSMANAVPPADNNHLRLSFPTTAHFHHIGSAPAGFPMETQFGFFSESPQSSFVGPYSHRGFGITMNNMQGITVPRRNASMNFHHQPGYGIMASAALGSIFMNGVPYPSSGPIVSDGFHEQGRSRRGGDHAAVYTDNKKQFQLDLDKIINGEDTRTTLMIKNIPNKYTSKMLLAAIDEHHRGTYDFLYLPIDFKNKCNVGYAFINMLSSSDIIPFYEAFNGNKWEKFNSEKVASLAYARIQGKAALVAHFQNSSLMNEDKRCRPILIYSSDDQKSGKPINPEIFVSGNMNALKHRPPDASPPPGSPKIFAMDGSNEIQNRS